jgi:MarR family transcriptional regulator, transcriptional regulator for hemolysin
MAAKPARKNAKVPVKKPLAAEKEAKGKKTVLTDENNWDQRLGFLMHDVSRLRRVAFDDFMKPTGVTRSQWWVLAYLSRHDGMTQTDLAGVLELGKAALGGLVDRLEAAEFLERRSDTTDRRVKRIYLTRKGTQMVKTMRQLSHEMSERILEGLGVDQRHELSDMLTLVKRNLVAIMRKADIAQ